MELILASSSRYRKALLNRLEIEFKCHSPDIDETPFDGEQPKQLTARLAAAKAAKTAANHPNALIIGSDQAAELNGTVINKPGSFKAAKVQLQQQSGHSVQFHTGLCLLDSSTGEQQVDVITTTASFRQLTEEEIERYLYKEQPFDCAGSFKSEQLGISLLNSMQGNDPTALVGLPLIRLCEMLRNKGVQIP